MNNQRSFLNKAQNLLTRIGDIGTQSEFETRANSKISLTNYMAVTLALISFPFSFQFYYLGFELPGLLVLIIVFLYLSAIYLNYIGWQNASKFWLIIVADFAAYKYAIFFGELSGIRYVLLSYLCIPFLLFELKNYIYIFCCSLICAFLFFILVAGYWDHSLTQISSDVQRIIYIPILGVVFFTILLYLFYLSYESSKYEEKLMRSKEQFEQEIKEARTVIDASQYSSKEDSIAQILQSQISSLQRSEEKLLKVNESLMKTNNDLDNFIYTASHDLKAPISNLEGLLNTMKVFKYNEIDEDINQIMEMMSLSIDRFKNTIAELTDISKLQKDTEQGENIVFEELFEDIKFTLNDSIVNSEVKIVANFESCPQINFSKKNLRSLFYNLVSNAIKYRSLERKLEVVVTTQKTSDGYVLLVVKDNGLGIRKEYTDKVFSMFKRAHNHVEGSGVGLYIVKRIMDNCGGKIELESDENQGAIFKLYFRENSIEEKRLPLTVVS